ADRSRVPPPPTLRTREGPLIAALRDSRGGYLRWKSRAKSFTTSAWKRLLDVWNGASRAWYCATVGGSTCERVTLPPAQMSCPWSVAVTGAWTPKYVFPPCSAAEIWSTICQVPSNASAAISSLQTLNRNDPRAMSPTEVRSLVKVFCCVCKVLTCVLSAETLDLSVFTSLVSRCSTGDGPAADQAAVA